MPETQMPDFVRPMLAQRSTPFDSDDYWFELKWDGMRPSWSETDPAIGSSTAGE